MTDIEHNGKPSSNNCCSISIPTVRVDSTFYMPCCYLKNGRCTTSRSRNMQGGAWAAISAVRGLTCTLLLYLLLAILVATLTFEANHLLSPLSTLLDHNQNQTFEMSERFEPVQVIEQYKRWHGVDALGKQGNMSTDESRKFAVAYLFPCAARAGNQFHNFYNNLLWAIITNRTLLVRFDSPTRQLCNGQPILNVASWLPLWDDWAARLGLSEDDIELVPIDTARERYDRDHLVVLFPQIPDVLHDNTHIFRSLWTDHATNTLFGIKVRRILSALFNGSCHDCFQHSFIQVHCKYGGGDKSTNCQALP